MSRVLDMTISEEWTKTLTEVAYDLAQAEAAVATATTYRAYWIHGAAKDGATMREIAAATGLSHQRVAQILGNRCPDITEAGIQEPAPIPFCDELNINYGETCSRKAKWIYEKEGTVRHYCTQHAPKRNRYCKPL